MYFTSWLSYLFTGTMAIVVSWMLGGCRLGNHVEFPKNPDQISGYYQTEPQSLAFYAKHSTEVYRETPISQIPALISDVISNPVALQVADLASGDAYLANSNRKVKLPITAHSNGVLDFVGATDPKPLLGDPQCTYQLYLQEDGTFSKFNEPRNPDNGPLLSGQIELKILVLIQWAGACSNANTLMQSCYQDVEKCGKTTLEENTERQAWVQALLNPFLAAGVLTDQELPALQAVGYEVLYK